jgi:hypothetical protein
MSKCIYCGCDGGDHAVTCDQRVLDKMAANPPPTALLERAQERKAGLLMREGWRAGALLLHKRESGITVTAIVARDGRVEFAS